MMSMSRAGWALEAVAVHVLVAFLLASIAAAGQQSTNDCVRKIEGAPCLPGCPRCLVRRGGIAKTGNCKRSGRMYTCRGRNLARSFGSTATVAPVEGELAQEELDMLDLEILSNSWEVPGSEEPLPTADNLRECSSVPGVQLPIELFQHFELTGRQCSLSLDTPRLDADFLNLVSGCVVNQGSWMIYSGPDFQGEVAILGPGTYEYPWLMEIANDGLSSARPFPPDDGSPASILLFEDPGFRGRMIQLTESTQDLWPLDFNDKASSAIVIRGTWRLHSGVNYGGAAFELAPGRHDSLLQDNDVSSAVVI